MQNDIKKSITDVIDILNHTDKDLVDKIPNAFLEFLNKNKDKDYQSNINYNDEKWTENLNEQTKAILALIYIDYLVDKEERERLIKEEQEELTRIEEENREKYNLDNIFKNRKFSEDEENKETKELIIVTSLPWYKRLLEKIKSIFGNKK